MIALCLACLAPRADLAREWVEAAAAGRPRIQYEARDDLAFVATKSVASPSTCAACGRSHVVIPMDEELAASIARAIAEP
ncbi:hypothetical protein [Sandaracinus amylolyticus]|nr:hypothetical protein [Sandaracinus amylolyticus]